MTATSSQSPTAAGTSLRGLGDGGQGGRAQAGPSRAGTTLRSGTTIHQPAQDLRNRDEGSQHQTTHSPTPEAADTQQSTSTIGRSPKRSRPEDEGQSKNINTNSEKANGGMQYRQTKVTKNHDQEKDRGGNSQGAHHGLLLSLSRLD